MAKMACIEIAYAMRTADGRDLGSRQLRTYTSGHDWSLSIASILAEAIRTMEWDAVEGIDAGSVIAKTIVLIAPTLPDCRDFAPIAKAADKYLANLAAED